MRTLLALAILASNPAHASERRWLDVLVTAGLARLTRLDALEHIGKAGGSAAFDAVAVNDGHIGHHVTPGLGTAGGRDDGFLELGRCLSL